MIHTIAVFCQMQFQGGYNNAYDKIMEDRFKDLKSAGGGSGGFGGGGFSSGGGFSGGGSGGGVEEAGRKYRLFSKIL